MSELAELLDRCRGGDALAWEALVRRFQGRVYSLAFHFLRDGEEARDTAQDVFVRVYRSLDSFSGDGFLSWILQLTRNAAIDRLRRRKARPPASDVPLESGIELPTGEPGPDAAFVTDGCHRLVYRALGRMSDQGREMILLKEIQGLRLNEIAAMLAIPLGTAKSRSHRARLELAQQVLALEPDYARPHGTGADDLR